jgi:hypothetical protein
MRTTLQIEDDALDAARSLARVEGRTLGQVVSELIRRGLAPRAERAARYGFPTFVTAPGARPITPEMVKRAADDEG